MKKITAIKPTKKLLSLFVFCFYFGFPQHGKAQNQVIPVWTTAIPGAISDVNYIEVDEYKEVTMVNVGKVVTPTLSIFLPSPEKQNGVALVICPGGGYTHLAIDKEGYKVAQWLNSIGVTAFVLKNRLPNDQIMKDKTIGPLQDAQESIRILRRNASKWNINPDKIGIMGFSAGGHLAATLARYCDENTYPVTDLVSARPNFSILVYPVISMREEFTHKGSKNSLIGKNPTEELVHYFSNEETVIPNICPSFLVHAADDAAVPVENTINYFMALKKQKVPAEMHVYEKGGHGFGLGRSDTNQFWTKDCENWLRTKFFK